MFGKLKEKLRGWFKKSEEKAEEIVETVEEEKKEKSKEETEGKEEIKLEKTEEKKPEKLIDSKIELEEIEEKAQIKEELEEAKGEKAEKKSFFGKLTARFKFKISKEYFDNIFSELEDLMLENNVALEVVDKVREGLKKELVGLEIDKDKVEEEIKKALKLAIETYLFVEDFDIFDRIKEKKKEQKEKEEKEPFVIVFFGINGSGKTTTIAKIASMLKKNNLKVVLAACDTFRAASIEQLSEHADKLKVEIIKNQYNADPASVGFDAIKHAKSKNLDVVLIDTAGRMHTKSSLMKEMEKIVRVTKPDLKIFIAESITGNDAIEQARIFNSEIGIDGIILSKTDVDEKSGTILSVSYVTGKPILYLGTGQDYGDLEKFKKEKILEQLGL